ncbi:RyR domain-containing protein [Streptomyces atratus]|uniref:RyR domain-containing protein n=1 Tax=Streptomyces atratus TaxID=1893 RepID=UPI0036545127
MSPEDIARVAHEANRAVQSVTGDPVPSPAWNEAPQWQRDSAVDGACRALDGETPEELHASWCEFKRSGGWTYGPTKDEQARTHPCLIPYADLPREQRVKDTLFGAVVHP